MSIMVSPPTRAWLEELVASGRFESTEAALDAVVTQFRLVDDLDDAAFADVDIASSLEQLDRGEGTPAKTVFARLRTRLGHSA
jgi:Arc/MetJ-type ribon-helix-helix transcriptional regulator